MVATHPRDLHVQYQEDRQRELEGDVVASAGREKVRVELQRLEETNSVATVQFLHEDHTLGNILRHVMMQNPEVTSAGYAIPHPLEPKMVVHVQSTQYAVDVVAEALEEVAQLCDKTLANFDAAVQQAV